MAHDRDTLVEIFAGWEHYQAHLINAVSPLTADQLALRAAPHLRPIAQLAAHIIGARARWFRNFLGEGDASLESLTVYGGSDQPLPTAAEAGRRFTGHVERDERYPRSVERRRSCRDLHAHLSR